MKKMKDVVRKNVQESIETLFQMELERSQFLVKNLTLANIIVRLGSSHVPHGACE